MRCDGGSEASERRVSSSVGGGLNDWDPGAKTLEKKVGKDDGMQLGWIATVGTRFSKSLNTIKKKKIQEGELLLGQVVSLQ